MRDGLDLGIREQDIINKLNEIRDLDDIKNRTDFINHEILQTQLNNAKTLLEVKRQYLMQEYEWKEKRDLEFMSKTTKRGIAFNTSQTANEKAVALLKEKNAKVAQLYSENLSKKDRDRKLKEINEEFKRKLKNEDALVQERIKLDDKARAADIEKTKNSFMEKQNFFTKSGREAAREQARESGMSEADIEKAERSANAQMALNLAGDFAKQLSANIKDIAYTKAEIDTRLQGSKKSNVFGSYWEIMNSTIAANTGVSPFVKQADVVNNLKSLVSKGIAYNVEQRAFLDTISDKIATTFEAADATLLKLIRIQQADTTAARLGMESALTAFLNNMYETTEYMTEAASSIRQNIYEASALMDAKGAAEFEYQVQKWMGSLYSVGFSKTSELATALGKLAAGDATSVTEGGFGNLLVMAANKANLPIAELLAQGLDDSNTNKLLKAVVDYLGEIYADTKNSRVVAQQFASVYGLTASDLKAAANLASSTKTISNQNLNYGGMFTQLNNMASTMVLRTSVGEMMENLWENLKYTISGGVANNPILYATYNIASMLDQVAGGIPLPMISVMGNTVDLHTTVADLMRVGAMSGGLLSGIGKLVVGLAKGSGGGFSGKGMLKAFGISESLSTVTRGDGAKLLTTSTGVTTSESGYVGNEDGGDVQQKTMQDAQEDGDKQMAEAQDETEETKLSTVDEHIVQIYTLLQNVTTGVSPFKVVLTDGPF